ncbi:MAG TPA: glucan biosynthesis protein D [Gammaproteobacteria bacterium]|nr:glucan biosynthesis protein D [Gammaproteobacteria bacterium]
MSVDLTRRRLLQAMGALGLLTITPGLDRALAATHATGLLLGPARPFSFGRLREHAFRLSKLPFQPVPVRHAGLLDRITYDVYQKIRFRSQDALWGGGGHRWPVELFHLGKYARRPVRIHAVANGGARRIRYSPDLFDYDHTGLRGQVPPDLGFSGFRVMNTGKQKGDWLAFQGASYFRSAGPLNQYGMSARGVAVDTTVPGHSEQFPRFTSFYLEEPADGHTFIVYALLDGTSLTGAYRIICHRHKAIVMDVHAELFQRTSVAQLGIAPLTSMYWYSETNERVGTDWHPEIHDSDGLAMWTGAGERIWVPLNDPPHVQTNSFTDHDPRGFGLLQRDRDFDHYLDDSAYYNRRPSVWVEPRGGWGHGAVVLMELPTDSETQDNIVAFWQPARKADAGTRWSLDYRLYWVAREPFPPAVAHVIATRLGRPGAPGQHKPRDPHGRKFVIEFAGGPLANMHQRFDIDAVVTASRGTVRNRHVLKILGTGRWRAQFDLHVTGTEPVNLRCYLRLGRRTLSETWLYQFFPGNYGFGCD